MFLLFSRRRKEPPRPIFLLDLLDLFKPADLSIDRIYDILSVPKENYSLQRSAGLHPKPPFHSHSHPSVVRSLS